MPTWHHLDARSTFMATLALAPLPHLIMQTQFNLLTKIKKSVSGGF
jgi:hypothetical protein